MREANEDLARQIWHKQRKNSLKEVVEKMCAEAGVKMEELKGESEKKGGRGKGKGSTWAESGNGGFHARDSPPFRSTGIGDCDGDSKRGAKERILTLLSYVPFALIGNSHTVEFLRRGVEKPGLIEMFRLWLYVWTPRFGRSMFSLQTVSLGNHEKQGDIARLKGGCARVTRTYELWK